MPLPQAELFSSSHRSWTLWWSAWKGAACLLSLPCSPSHHPSLIPSQSCYLLCHRLEVSPSESTVPGPKTSPCLKQLTQGEVRSELSAQAPRARGSEVLGEPSLRDPAPTKDWPWPLISSFTPSLSDLGQLASSLWACSCLHKRRQHLWEH